MRFLSTIFLTFILLVVGCGGGSEGTGSAGSISGTLRAADNSAIAGAAVTIVETGESDITDENGNFTIITNLAGSDVNLLIETATTQSTINVGAIDADSENIRVDIVIAPNGSTVSPRSLSVWARMVDECDRYFENRPIIRQSVKTPSRVTCKLKFFVSGAGQRLERIAGELQVRSCSNTTWKTIARGETGFGATAGFGYIDFPFTDSEKTCEYRLAAPSNATNLDPIYVYISTFTLQNSK